jgi:hypothetical protein
MLSILARIFSVSRNAVDWKATFLLALMRSCSAGLVIGILNVVGGQVGQGLGVVLIGGLVGLFFFIPLAMLGRALAVMFPPAGLLCLPALIFMAIGDPLLWIAEKFRPGTVPCEPFRFVNFMTVILVMNTDVIHAARDDAVHAAKAAASGALDRLRNR